MSRAVCLVDTDPDLVDGIPAEDRDLARSVLTLPLYHLPTGRWEPKMLSATHPSPKDRIAYLRPKVGSETSGVTLAERWDSWTK